MKYLYIVLSFIAISSLAVSCKKDKAPGVGPVDVCADTVSFTQVVQPLIEQNCATSGCHDANTAQSGFNFSGHFNISVFSDSMIGAIRHDPGFVPMPFAQPKFADSLIQQIECWIAQGKLDN